MKNITGENTSKGWMETGTRMSLSSTNLREKEIPVDHVKDDTEVRTGQNVQALTEGGT